MQQQEQNSELCTNDCGFFGSNAYGGMCSVCWKKTLSNRVNVTASPKPNKEIIENTSVHVEIEQKETIQDVISISNMDTNEKNDKTIQIEETMIQKEEVIQETRIQKNKKRCFNTECNKKVGLTGGIQCRCGFIFCGIHRYPDQHNCSFDYKTQDRKELAKRNPGGGTFLKMGDKL